MIRLPHAVENVSGTFLVPNPVPGRKRVTIREYRFAARDRVVGVKIPAGGKRFIHFLRAVSKADLYEAVSFWSELRFAGLPWAI